MLAARQSLNLLARANLRAKRAAAIGAHQARRYRRRLPPPEGPRPADEAGPPARHN
ncbi:hypothetical protein [uncultured Thiohalocapsa sp.]|uniref:hypothetical protein n=1 Tax=uncultured Thiohalocapsa sp. TaxID=768990 RepID=UPI0025D3A8D4|nr:hypothetical protein [uncultured Thiohalocapsa sp.]